MRHSRWIASCAGLAGALILWASQAMAESKSLPVDVQLGFELNDVTLAGPKSAGTRSTTDTQYSESPVFKIVSPIKLGCLLNARTWDRGKAIERHGCFGFGIRASGAQKRLDGKWFALNAAPTATPTYEYRSDQIAGELLFGQLSDVSLAYGVSVRAGINNYDLNVFNGSQRLASEQNRLSGFASWAAYLDLQTLFWPFLGFGNWPFSPFFVLLSYEETLPGNNTIQAPNLNGTGKMNVDVRTRTQTITLEVMF